MSIIYHDNEPKPQYPIPLHRLNPHSNWLKHYGNYLYLKFIADHPNTSFQEKRQARKEIDIAERKMAFWKRHPNFQPSLIEQGKQELDAQWRTK